MTLKKLFEVLSYYDCKIIENKIISPYLRRIAYSIKINGEDKVLNDIYFDGKHKVFSDLNRIDYPGMRDDDFCRYIVLTLECELGNYEFDFKENDNLITLQNLKDAFTIYQTERDDNYLKKLISKIEG
ncbi:hypothetical protein ES703_51603 [subsurface metagenome]